MGNVLYLQKKLGLKAASILNFAVSDGNTTLVSRIYTNNQQKQNGKNKGASLYFSCGSMWAKCSDKEYRMRHTNRNEDVVIIASERLSMNIEDWVEVPSNHILLVSNKANVLLFPINVENELKKFEKEMQKNENQKAN